MKSSQSHAPPRPSKKSAMIFAASDLVRFISQLFPKAATQS